MKFPSLSEFFQSAKSSAKRFPLVLLTAFVSFSYFAVATEHNYNLHQLIPAFTLILGIPLFFAIDIHLESRKTCSAKHRIFFWVIGTAFLFSFHFAFGTFASERFAINYLLVSLLIHLLVSFSGYFSFENDNGFWQFNRIIFLRFLLSLLYASVFFGGISIALISISKLFSVDISGNFFLQLWLFSIFFIHTWHFLSGIPNDITKLGTEQHYPKGLRVFVQFLLIPIVSIYMTILYIYMSKILFTGIWPQGYIGWLVSIISTLGIFNLLLLDPEKIRPQYQWIKTYTKIFYLAIIPLLVMLFAAIGQRISEYGVTEKRYVLTILGMSLLLLAFYFLLSKSKNIKFIPMSLFAVCLIALWGPISASNMSLRSQTHRLESLLMKNQLLEDGKATSANNINDISDSDAHHISSILDYIIQNHGVEKLSNIFPKEVIESTQKDPQYTWSTRKPSQQNSIEALKYLNIEYHPNPESQSKIVYETFQSEDEDNSIELPKFKYMVHLRYLNESFLLGPKREKIDYSVDGMTIVFTGNKGVVAKFDLEPFVENLRSYYDKYNIPAKLMWLDSTEGNNSFKIHITRLDISTKKEGSKISSMSGFLFINE